MIETLYSVRRPICIFAPASVPTLTAVALPQFNIPAKVSAFTVKNFSLSLFNVYFMLFSSFRQCPSIVLFAYL